MLLRDRLAVRLREMADAPDYQRLASEVLGIRNAPPELARRLVAQALVVEDRRTVWTQIGERICVRAPQTAGVYTLRDASGQALYVGKTTNLRRRLRAHFSGTRWRHLKAGFARATDAEWTEVGSELEALLREATLIAQLRPPANIQIGQPNLAARAVPSSLVRDVLVVVPSIEADSVELVAARADGLWRIQRVRRRGADLPAADLRRFFRARPAPDNRPAARLAPIVFSWLARRGATASRLDPHDAPTAKVLRAQLAALLCDEALFAERIVVR